MTQSVVFNPRNEKIEEKAKLVIYDEKNKKIFLQKELDLNESFNLKETELDQHLKYIYKYQVQVEGEWKDKTGYRSIKFEKETNKGIKYILLPEPNSEYLIVGFQGISKTPGYNYVRSLKDVNAIQLYIKDDYGTDITTSSYYLGGNGSLDIAEGTLELIEEVRLKYGISKDKVICIGSSKGGFASLYFTYKGKYGNAVVGGPQVKLGTYLSKGKKADDLDPNSFMPKILEYLIGDITDKKIAEVDDILFNVIKNSDHDPNIYIHVGEGEPHYKKHVLPFLELAKMLNLKNIRLDLGDYDNHNDLAKHFPNKLKEEVNRLI